MRIARRSSITARWPALRGALPALPLVKIAIEVDDGGEAWQRAQPYEALLAASVPAPRIARQADDYHLMYTGGTTGLPRVCIYVAPWSTGLTAMFATNVPACRPRR